MYVYRSDVSIFFEFCSNFLFRIVHPGLSYCYNPIADAGFRSKVGKNT